MQDEEAVPDVSSPAHHTEVCPWAGQACPPDVIQASGVFYVSAL